ncbi:lipoyl(octanoyl) transferase LipB [Puniceicoccales bacterium CK1056]|uniref:Octanoyltransferase n=2 Tax=Oceanipulchritudo coccoides TaxID=2706888 RepID=A0A6B2LXF6_9BACT|nr:lipoyl(octanoyl) transferase LipB [Oceanipulchritudo coccoides]
MQQTVDWGRTAYREAWDRQLELVENRKAGGCADTLVLTEHEPVFTIGARQGAGDHLVWTQSMLESQGIEVVKTNRGGDITYHGPGQIVGYPIMSLRERKDLHAYLRELEEVLIRTVGHFGINATRREGKTGIWIKDRKIAAIGVAVKSWITYHGFALNVNPDLAHYAGIVPCGITDGSVTSLEQECEAPPLIGQVKSRLILEFWNLFGNRT